MARSQHLLRSLSAAAPVTAPVRNAIVARGSWPCTRPRPAGQRWCGSSTSGWRQCSGWHTGTPLRDELWGWQPPAAAAGSRAFTCDPNSSDRSAQGQVQNGVKPGAAHQPDWLAGWLAASSPCASSSSRKKKPCRLRMASLLSCPAMHMGCRYKTARHGHGRRGVSGGRRIHACRRHLLLAASAEHQHLTCPVAGIHTREPVWCANAAATQGVPAQARWASGAAGSKQTARGCCLHASLPPACTALTCSSPAGTP